MLLVGLDPGGHEQFGWSVLEGAQKLPLILLRSGIANNAAEALAVVKENLGSGYPDGVGIDSPLFWVARGDRTADYIVREAIKRAGAKHAGGTVQHVNSLRGACLTQGILAAHLARSAWPEVRITEAHPKALLWLLFVASKVHPAKSVGMDHLKQFILSRALDLTEHQRDAALAGFAAWSMLTAHAGWQNLAALDKDAFMPVPNIEYWMPLPIDR